MGYLEGTFSTSRAWLTFIKENKNVYKCFKNGLEEEDKGFFEKVVQEYDYYSFNILLALYQLQRYKRKGKDFVDFSSKLLRIYISPSEENPKQLELKKLYDRIREISFITLDSIYAPVPFNIDLASILLNFDDLVESLFLKNTSYQIALLNLERVLQDSVYMCTDSCLSIAKASEDTFIKLDKNKFRLNSISQIDKIMLPKHKDEINSDNIVEQDWLSKRKIIQEFFLSQSEWKIVHNLISDEVKYEINLRKKIGTSRIRTGVLLNSRKNTLKVAYGITTSNNTQSIIAALKIIQEVCILRNKLIRNGIQPQIDNEENLMSFFCKSIFGWNKRFILENKNIDKSAILISTGKIEMLKLIDVFIETAKDLLNEDEIFEVKKIKNIICHIHYSGLTVVFVGGTKLYEENSNQECAEFDGIVFKPTLNPKKHFAYIIEAKNYRKGAIEAEKQLNKRLEKQLLSELEYNTQIFDDKCAFSSIKLRHYPC